MPLPVKLLRQGVTDMVRISDARLSGTAYGTTVLHTAPESKVGGALALVQTGDLITLDVPGRRLTLDIDDAELDRRRIEWRAPPPPAPPRLVPPPPALLPPAAPPGAPGSPPPLP